jgi:hypothetical protein
MLGVGREEREMRERIVRKMQDVEANMKMKKDECR